LHPGSIPGEASTFPCRQCLFSLVLPRAEEVFDAWTFDRRHRYRGGATGETDANSSLIACGRIGGNGAWGIAGACGPCLRRLCAEALRFNGANGLLGQVWIGDMHRRRRLPRSTGPCGCSHPRQVRQQLECRNPIWFGLGRQSLDDGRQQFLPRPLSRRPASARRKHRQCAT